ncbi:MAG: hypothetical protein AB3N13_07375 [Arenibacterium sp.]
MPEDFTRIAAERASHELSATPGRNRVAARPKGVSIFQTPPLQDTRPPRCPPFVEVTHPDQHLPYLGRVAQRSCAKYGDVDLWLDESWNPAVPGLNMEGDYWDHYVRDLLHWVKTELEVCRSYHPLFMKMTGADDKYSHGPGADRWKGGCCNHSGVQGTILSVNCCRH